MILDVTLPVITLLGDATLSVARGESYSDSGATALDNIDGDLTSNIVTVNEVDTDVFGTYFVTYDVKDSTGNAADQVTRVVRVVDGKAPVVTTTNSTTADGYYKEGNQILSKDVSFFKDHKFSSSAITHIPSDKLYFLLSNAFSVSFFFDSLTIILLFIFFKSYA